MKNYKEVKTDFGTIITATQGDVVLWIPTDPANRDYAEYLRFTAWVAEGNDPDEFGAE